ncbi:hypothetical protein Trco_005488 [Trichoderma cornu-damae]|uniref:Uncharacterized protein n=1 Tax=Trichoderma cornu-damae TaxID=654480 RepID=A0A9P8QHE7_9HYPO|nr:hypothetical protein Trco_005488 [Trichoderma cornu-damae]
MSVDAAFDHWNYQAYQKADARALAASVGMNIPTPQAQGHGLECGLMYPIRRLVVTGKDTPENFRILFGTDQLGTLHKEQRRNVLMSLQQRGSPAAKLQGFYDRGCPEFTPRPASDAEKEELLSFVGGCQEAALLLREVSQR